MGALGHRPLLYVFLEAHDLAAQRAFLETRVGLPVLEVDPDPTHRHGVVKYDAGTVVIGLNLSPAARFARGGHDALTMVFAGGHARHDDAHGHRYVLGDEPPTLVELRLRVADPAACVPFYRDVLGLPLRESTPGAARFATASVPLVLHRSPVGAQDARRDTYLLVFHTPDVAATRAGLAARGLAFAGATSTAKGIGATARFADPSGHRFCLYQPSKEALAWPSGPKVRQLAAGRG